MTKKKIDINSFYIQHGIDIIGRQIFLDEEVSELSMGWIMRSIQMMIEINAETPIKLFINSFGGDVYSGLALFDLLESLPCEVHTTCLGSAMSMSLILFLVGDVREAYPRSTFMAHSLSGGIEGNMAEMKIDLDESKRLNNILLKILADRTKKSLNWWKKEVEHEDKYYDYKKSIKLGIITEE